MSQATERPYRPRHARVRPYLVRPTRPVPPTSPVRGASPVPLELLTRVRDGLAALDTALPRVSRGGRARALAAELAPLARAPRARFPDVWAPTECNAPATAGRGLALVDALAARWWTYPCAGGRVTGARIDLG